MGSGEFEQGTLSDGATQQPVVAEVVPNFEATPAQYPPTSSGSGCKWIAVGCAVTFFVMLLVMVGIGYWGYRNVDRLAAKVAVTTVRAVVEESPLSPEQQKQLMQRVEDLGDRYAKGEVTAEELAEVAERLAEEESVVTAGLVYVLETQVLDQAEIDEELRGRLKRVTDRLARGVIEDNIDVEELKPLLENIFEETPEGPKVKPDLKPEDFGKFLESAEKIADEAEIPDEPYEIDFLEEVDKIIDEVLNDTPRL